MEIASHSNSINIIALNSHFANYCGVLRFNYSGNELGAPPELKWSHLVVEGTNMGASNALVVCLFGDCLVRFRFFLVP